MNPSKLSSFNQSLKITLKSIFLPEKISLVPFYLFCIAVVFISISKYIKISPGTSAFVSSELASECNQFCKKIIVCMKTGNEDLYEKFAWGLENTCLVNCRKHSSKIEECLANKNAECNSNTKCVMTVLGNYY